MFHQDPFIGCHTTDEPTGAHCSRGRDNSDIHLYTHTVELAWDQRAIYVNSRTSSSSGMGLTAGFAWAPPLAGARKRRHDVEGRDQGRQITREAITKEHWDARDAGLGS